MKILIIGASSYVGAKIYVDLKTKFEIVGTYFHNKLFSELELLDITNKANVENSVQKHRPDFIIHVAAHANRAWCQENPEQALVLNEEGTKNIVDAANSINAKIIFISTLAIASSESIYGHSKITGENVIKNTKAGYIILRPSLIFGFSPNVSNDRPFNRLLKNITENTPAIYDTSWKFQPTLLKHLSEVVELIITRNILNEIIPICIPEIKSRFEIAQDILSKFNIEVRAEDKQDHTPNFGDDLTKLKALNLPIYTYHQLVKNIQEEVQDYLSKK